MRSFAPAFPSACPYFRLSPHMEPWIDVMGFYYSGTRRIRITRSGGKVQASGKHIRVVAPPLSPHDMVILRECFGPE